MENTEENQDRLSNFFTQSTVSRFLERNKKNALNENVVVDFDGRAYVRIMKMFKQKPKTKLKFQENLNEDGICLQDEMNKDFHLRFYLPKSIIGTVGGKVSKVVIMINGMNELEHYHFYDTLGGYFATNNIGAILLTTPFNLSRRIKEDWENKDENNRPFWPTKRAKNGNEMLFVHSFLKTYKELNYLIDKIKGQYKNSDEKEDYNFYKNYFDGKNVEVSLLGYSLGGLKALGYFLKDFKPLPNQYTKDKKINLEFEQQIKEIEKK